MSLQYKYRIAEEANDNGDTRFCIEYKLDGLLHSIDPWDKLSDYTGYGDFDSKRKADKYIEKLISGRRSHYRKRKIHSV